VPIPSKRYAAIICAFAALCLGGCRTLGGVQAYDLPRESKRIDLPNYVIAPPDVLVINALRIVPMPPYFVQPLDSLNIQVTPTPAEQPILGIYHVNPEGTVNLGFGYGVIDVTDKTIPQVREALNKHLKAFLKDFEVSVSLAQSEGLQQIRGEHLVRPDGTIGLGEYGSVKVSGLTIDEAKRAIEGQLSQFLLNPKVAVDVSGFNSKAYYVVTDGAGFGEQVVRLPSMGSETVLDAVSQVYGLSPVSSRHRVWIARPVIDKGDCWEVLPVDWVAITQKGSPATNYQVLPGDRIYIKAQPIITFDTYLTRIISPIERMLGVTLLGSETVNSIRLNGKLGVGTTGR
jgi:polysaccharide biosynthesis/export protein